MAFDGRTHRLGDDQTDARAIGHLAATPAPDVNNNVGLRGAHPVLHRCVKLSRPPHAVACGKHRQRTRRCDQADNARRPLRRRLDTIERPARVRIRRRKPCTRARRRLFGWKVRLPLATAFSSFVSSSKHLSRPTTSPVRRSGVVLLLAGAVPKTRHFGSQPYRRLSGDCLRVLTSLLRVKPGLSQWCRPNIVQTLVVGKTNPRGRRCNRNKPQKNHFEWNRTVGSRTENC